MRRAAGQGRVPLGHELLRICQGFPGETAPDVPCLVATASIRAKRSGRLYGGALRLRICSEETVASSDSREGHSERKALEHLPAKC